MRRITASHLRRLRNDIPISEVIRRQLDGMLRFLFPLCHGFQTATNPNTNLARCFRCEKNFNPIDLVMVVKECSFLQAVRFLERRE